VATSLQSRLEILTDNAEVNMIVTSINHYCTTVTSPLPPDVTAYTEIES